MTRASWKRFRGCHALLYPSNLCRCVASRKKICGVCCFGSVVCFSFFLTNQNGIALCGLSGDDRDDDLMWYHCYVCTMIELGALFREAFQVSLVLAPLLFPPGGPALLLTVCCLRSLFLHVFLGGPGHRHSPARFFNE